jgi:hypothetical protein
MRRARLRSEEKAKQSVGVHNTPKLRAFHSST